MRILQDRYSSSRRVYLGMRNTFNFHHFFQEDVWLVHWVILLVDCVERHALHLAHSSCRAIRHHLVSKVVVEANLLLPANHILDTLIDQRYSRGAAAEDETRDHLLADPLASHGPSQKLYES